MADGSEGNRHDWGELMRRGQDGDRRAYEQLLTELAPFVRALGLRHGLGAADAADLVQDVLLTLHAIRHTYDPHRPFGPWLTVIARRRLADRLRRGARRRAREVALEPVHETFAAPAANLAGEGRALRAAIAALPEGQRRAVGLLKIEELSLKEAATRSGMTVAALKVAVHRGLKALRRALAEG